MPMATTGPGLLVREDFLHPRLCTQIRQQMLTGPTTPGTVLSGTCSVVDDQVRKVDEVDVAAAQRSAVVTRLRTLMPEVGQRFGVHPRGLTDPQFVKYDPGAFFVFHRDRDDAKDEPDHVRARLVSLVVFLSAADVDHGGGELEFYGPDLDGRPATKFRVPARPGTLVAFDPRTRHQVRPVTRGQRCTIVSWFV